jgi:hypothetical protein
MPKPVAQDRLHCHEGLQGAGCAGRQMRCIGRRCRAQPQAVRAAGQFECYPAICRLLACGSRRASPDYDATTGAWIEAADAEE